MRLLFVHGYAGPFSSAAHQGILSRDISLYAAWSRARFNVFVATTDTSRFALDASGRVVHISLGRAHATARGVVIHRHRLAQAVARIRPDIVVADITSAPMWIGLRLRCPLVVRAEWFWADVSRIEDGVIEARAKLRLEKYMVSRAAALSVSSNLLAQHMGALGASRIEVIPNFVPPPFFEAAAKDSCNVVRSSHPLRMLSVGRLVALKRHEALIRAVGLVPGVIRPTITLIGSGPLREDLQRLALKEGVELTSIGRIDNVDMPQVMADADILCHLSRHEGAPRAILEAFSVGLPVATVAWDGVGEMIGCGEERGVLLPAGPNDLAARIMFLQGQAGRKQLGRAAAAAQEWARDNCSLDAHVRLTSRLLANLLRIDRGSNV